MREAFYANHNEVSYLQVISLTGAPFEWLAVFLSNVVVVCTCECVSALHVLSSIRCQKSTY